MCERCVDVWCPVVLYNVYLSGTNMMFICQDVHICTIQNKKQPTCYPTANFHTAVLIVKSVVVSIAATVVEAEAFQSVGVVVPLGDTVPAASCVRNLCAAHCE